MLYERFYLDERSIVDAPEQFIASTLKIHSALEFAKEAHRGQVRKTGEAFHNHPIQVAQILMSWGLGRDEDLICAALLHDVPEDNKKITIDEISERFGRNVAKLVDGVTKVDNTDTMDVDGDTLRKVSSHSFLEPKVALIKVADRLHNMRTLEGMKSEKQNEKSLETIGIYAKLAESLGLWMVKKELEDISFRYLDPNRFMETKALVDSDPRRDANFLAHTISSLQSILLENGVEGRAVARFNGYWGLYSKREKSLVRGRTTAARGYKDINDLVSFRVIIGNSLDCYQVIGAVHERYGQYVDFDRYDEFMGVNRRINGYSALQTTLDLPVGAVEIAVATEEMERFNKRGVASLLEQGETNLEKYALKWIFSSDEGKGVTFLPKAATGVDYAYSINQRLGANAIHIIVDGVAMPLSTIIPNASTIEVVTGEPRRAPNPDLLNYCLPHTRNMIEEQLNQAGTDELAIQGRILAENILSRRGLLRFEDLENVANELVFDYSANDLNEIYCMIANGAIRPNNLEEWLDRHGITKENLNITSLKFNGINRKGILMDVSRWISEMGGDIRNIETKTNDRTFTMLLVVIGLNQENEEELKQYAANDVRFTTWIIA